MIDRPDARIWPMRAVFVLVAMLLLYLRLLPLDNPAGAWGAPDLLLAMSFAWVLRRPEFIPPLALAAVWLLADLMLLRPPGLMAMLVLAAALILRQKQRELGEVPFALEWGTVSLACLVILLAQRLVLGLFLVPMPPAGQGVIQVIVTALSYPVVVLATEYLFGVRRIAPGEIGAGRVRL